MVQHVVQYIVLDVDLDVYLDVVLNPIRPGEGHFVPGSFSYCDFQNFSIATMS